MRWGSWGSAVSAMYATGVTTMLLRNAEHLKIDSAAYFTPVNEGAIRVYPNLVCFAPDGEILKRMAVHIDGILCPTDDECSVQTQHDGWFYYSVYNPSAEQAKTLPSLSGDYELLVPVGDRLELVKGHGQLNELPPAAAAFVRSGC